MEKPITFYGNKKTEFTIVIPSNYSHYEREAASELTAVLKLSTGAEWIWCTDNFITARNKILSIGRTKYFYKNFKDADLSCLGEDGFAVKSCGNSIYICGGGNKGTLYGVYSFLQHAVGYKAYAVDEISYIKTDRIEFSRLDIKEKPDFDERCLNFTLLNSDRKYRSRMRVAQEDDGWILWAHTFFLILPPEKYLKDNPDWYSKDVKQLCLTNDAMKKEFVKNLIEIIKENTNYRYIMLGQEDTDSFCYCEKCKKEIDKYRESGVLIRFINSVVKETNRWIEENQSGRKLYFVTFCYQKTLQPPATENANGGFEPIDESCKAEKNVGIMVAPLYACYSHPFFDSPCNREVERVIKAWNCISGRLFMWSYCTNFYTYMIPFYNFDAIKENYREFKKHNFKYLFDQGTREECITNFQALRIYMHSQLMWDTEQDELSLQKDFIKHYYKSAAHVIGEIFFDVLGHFRRLDYDCGFHAYPSNGKGAAVENKKYWPKEFLYFLLKEFAEAELCINSEEEELKELLKNRILREAAAFRYLLLQLYIDEMDIDEAEKQIKIFEGDCAFTGITCYGEWPEQSGKTIENKIKQWKDKLYKGIINNTALVQGI